MTAEATRPTPAATVVPLRDGDAGLEVLMLRRNSRGPFGGMWVFPGGKVEPEDLGGAEPADPVASVLAADGGGEGLGPAADGGGEGLGPVAGGSGAVELAAARRAAVREAAEEAGIRIDPSSLVVLSFWLPPPEAPRRFATWFFLAPLAAARDVVVDQTEIRDHRWLGPESAIRARHTGEMDLAPPTFTTLWWLSRHPSTASALAAAAAQREPGRFETHVAVTADGQLRATLWAGDAGYEDGDLERPGPRRRLVMDPGGWRVEITP